MTRTQLAVASVALAAASCLAVVYALREAPDRGPAPAAAPVETPATPDVAAPAPAHAPSPAPEDLLAENARAADTAEQAVRDALLAAADDESLPLDAKLDRYREAVASARERLNAPMLANPGMVAELFFRADAVQRELAAMSPGARSGALAHVRRELGFDEAAVEREGARDERREARWQNGFAYMAERERIAASFSGEALEAELSALREAYFAHEAPTIEREEGEGFFRFERPRIYGRN